MRDSGVEPSQAGAAGDGSPGRITRLTRGRWFIPALSINPATGAAIIPAMNAPMLPLVALVALLAGCARLPVYESRPVAAGELQQVRERVREYAKTHCGTCHIASLPTARPAALAIYNLDAKEWSSTLTAAQLRNGFPRRLNGRLDEEGKRELKTFIEAELALRR